MFEHYRLPGGSQGEAETGVGAQDFCDLWLPESPEKSLPLVCYFDGALSEEDSKAREERMIHLPFYQQMAEEIYQSGATPLVSYILPVLTLCLKRMEGLPNCSGLSEHSSRKKEKR